MNTAHLAKQPFSRCALFQKAGEPLVLEQLPLFQPEPGEILVRIEACSLCGSDLHTVQGLRTEKTPTILGHEIIGVIEELGRHDHTDAMGNSLRVGDRITWSVFASCQECDRCRRGFPQKCRDLVKYGHERAQGRYALSGGLAEKILLRRGTTILKVADEVPAEAFASLNCATSTVAAAYRVAGSALGTRVLILGLGLLGLTALAYARATGAAQVIGIDLDEARVSLAPSFGADKALQIDNTSSLSQVLGVESETRSFDTILDFTGSNPLIEEALEFGDIGSRLILVGSVKPSPPLKLDPEQLVRRCQRLVGIHNYAPIDLVEAHRFMQTHHQDFPFAELVSGPYSLEDINQAIEVAITQRPVRVLIKPTASSSLPQGISS